MGDRDDTVAQFIAITACDPSVALHVLEACGWDLEAAINLQLSDGAGMGGVQQPAQHAPPAAMDSSRDRLGGGNGGGGVPIPASSSSGGDDGRHPSGPVRPSNSYDEVAVRAPIRPRQDTLVDAVAPAYVRRRPQVSMGFDSTVQRHAFDPFRKVEAETLRDPEQAAKMSALSKLYEPPLDLIFPGSLEEALRSAKMTQKWVLVNVQANDEFACQTLNRDVWRAPMVQELLREHFVFWQRLKTTDDARRYKQLYPHNDVFPHMAVLDAATGQSVKELPVKQSVDSFLDFAYSFVERHQGGSNAIPMAKPNSGKRARTDVAALSEDDMLAAAIAASLQDSSTGTDVVTIDDDDDDDIILGNASDKGLDSDSAIMVADQPASSSSSSPAPASSSAAPAVQAVALRPEPSKDDTSEALHTVRFMLPKNSRLQRRFYTSDTLGALMTFVAQESGMALGTFDLVAAYPRRVLSDGEPGSSLESLKLSKSESIHVQDKA